MSCFIVPATEAVVTTVVKKAVNKKECADNHQEKNTEKSPFITRLNWLNNMLWGGSALLLFEHIWHGEVTPFFPFITAMNSAQDTVSMLKEMSTVGVGMAAAVTSVWAGMVVISNAIAKRNEGEVIE